MGMIGFLVEGRVRIRIRVRVRVRVRVYVSFNISISGRSICRRSIWHGTCMGRGGGRGEINDGYTHPSPDAHI